MRENSRLPAVTQGHSRLVRLESNAVTVTVTPRLRVGDNRGLSDQTPANPEEDFATLFAASTQTKRLAPGQSVTAPSSRSARTSRSSMSGRRAKRRSPLDELKDDDGDIASSNVGDRIEATIVSMTGGITLSRRLQRGAATRQQVEARVSRGLPVEGKVESQVKGGYTRHDREAARVLSGVADRYRPRHRSGVASGPRLRVPHHRVSRERTEVRRVAPRVARGRAEERARWKCARPLTVGAP